MFFTWLFVTEHVIAAHAGQVTGLYSHRVHFYLSHASCVSADVVTPLSSCVFFLTLSLNTWHDADALQKHNLVETEPSY